MIRSEDEPVEPRTPPPAPALRIVRGAPDATDVAVLTAVLAALGGGDAAPTPGVRRGGWNDPGAQHRRALVPGPNAWRAAYLP